MTDDKRDTPTSDPPASSASSTPPPSAKKSSSAVPHSQRSTIALITAITGLVSALAAMRREPSETTAKESYTILQKAFAEQQSEVEETKREVLELRQSFEAYARAKEGSVNVAHVMTAPGDVIPSVEVRVQPTNPDAGAAPPAVVVIPSARPAQPPQAPLPNVSQLEDLANAKRPSGTLKF